MRNDGIFTVEVRAFTEDGVPTDAFDLLKITVTDPCITTTLTIGDSVFKTTPEVTLTQFVLYDPLSIEWTDEDILISDYGPLATSKLLCGPITHEIVNSDNGSPLDVAVFPTQDFTST